MSEVYRVEILKGVFCILLLRSDGIHLIYHEIAALLSCPKKGRSLRTMGIFLGKLSPSESLTCKSKKWRGPRTKHCAIISIEDALTLCEWCDNFRVGENLIHMEKIVHKLHQARMARRAKEMEERKEKEYQQTLKMREQQAEKQQIEESQKFWKDALDDWITWFPEFDVVPDVEH